jgi:hypothetical protein
MDEQVYNKLLEKFSLSNQEKNFLFGLCAICLWDCSFRKEEEKSCELVFGCWSIFDMLFEEIEMASSLRKRGIIKDEGHHMRYLVR